MTFPFPTFAPASREPASIDNTDFSVDTTNTTTFTFSAQALGTPTATRFIVIAADASAGSTPTFSGITVGGVAASQVITEFSAGLRTAMYVVSDTTNTTADIVVTFGSSVDRCEIGVWAVYGCSITPTDTASDNSTTPMNAAIDVAAGGVAVAVASNYATPRTATWANLTEDYDQEVESATAQSGASDVFAGAQTALDIQATLSGASDGQVLLVASFPPLP